MVDINKKIKSLKKKRDTQIKKINFEHEKNIKKLTVGLVKDNLDVDDCLKFDFKKNTIVSSQYGFTLNKENPCNKWSKKSDWFFVEVEDYAVYQTYTDAGYGDGDETTMFRTISRYKVCPNCGMMIHLSTKKFESGASKTRWEDSVGFDIRPKGWTPKIKIIGRKKNKK